MPDTLQTMPQIGDTAPEFYASSTNGTIHFPHDFMGKWVVFFSHPSDFTPVCTTEFIQFQHDINEFKKINNKPIIIDNNFNLFEIIEYVNMDDIGQDRGNSGVVVSWVDKVVKVKRMNNK